MCNSTITKNDCAWEKLFDKYKIIENINKDGQFIINSWSINEFREARLMTKFDHHNNLPTLFQENQLSILPITRGDYVIAKFEAYKSLEQHDDEPIEYLKFPEHIQSIDYKNITGEATVINSAYISGIFAQFFEEEELLPTVNGRMSSEAFNFDIKNLKNSNLINLDVVNSQIEIDGGYEGIGSLSLIEAKNSISSDFLVRQLYYPFRLWKNKVSKEVKSIFLIYTNGIFSLYEYKFENPKNYNSLVLIKHKRYSLEANDITLCDIQHILQATKVVKEPEIPFPQADSFERVINLCELLRAYLLIKSFKPDYLIRLNKKHDCNVQFATLTHELAHLYLGHLGADKFLKTPDRQKKTHEIKELEAESVCYIVCCRNNVVPNSEAYLTNFVDDKLQAEDMDLYALLKAAGQIETILDLVEHTSFKH